MSANEAVQAQPGQFSRTASRPAQRGGPTAKSRWRLRAPLMPAMIFTIVVTQVPFLITIWFSLQRWNMLVPKVHEFVGVANFAAVFQDQVFLTAVLNTFEMTIGAVLGSLVVGLILAWLMNHTFMGRGLVRTFMITPFLILPAATALLWKTSMLDASFGLLNFFLRPFGGGSTDWVAVHPMGSIIVTLVWQWAPFMMLILLAGLQGESVEALEAANVDGASAWQVFRYITLPHLRRFIELAAFLGTVYMIQTFDTVYLQTQGGPGTATTNLPYYLYLKAFRTFDVGKSATLSVVVLVGTLIVASFAIRVVFRMLNETEGKNS